jgi:hypothetical protein
MRSHCIVLITVYFSESKLNVTGLNMALSTASLTVRAASAAIAVANAERTNREFQKDHFRPHCMGSSESTVLKIANVHFVSPVSEPSVTVTRNTAIIATVGFWALIHPSGSKRGLSIIGPTKSKSTMTHA